MKRKNSTWLTIAFCSLSSCCCAETAQESSTAHGSFPASRAMYWNPKKFFPQKSATRKCYRKKQLLDFMVPTVFYQLFGFVKNQEEQRKKKQVIDPTNKLP